MGDTTPLITTLWSACNSPGFGGGAMRARLPCSRGVGRTLGWDSGNAGEAACPSLSDGLVQGPGTFSSQKLCQRLSSLCRKTETKLRGVWQRLIRESQPQVSLQLWGAAVGISELGKASLQPLPSSSYGVTIGTGSCSSFYVISILLN